VSAIFRAGIIPSCLEFIEKDAIDITIDYLGETAIKIPENTAAQLLIEVDGQYLEPLYSDCEKIDRVLQKFNCGEVLFADNAEQSNALWKLRRTISSAIKEYAACKKADTVVPRANLPELIEGIKEIAAAYKIRCICYGHAGDGNLHVNIIRENCSDTYWETELPKAQRAIFRLVKKLKGTISGEHGIGWVQREFMDEAFSPDELFVQRSVKKAFDPKGLFNPHKLFPE
jgi:glycolate oxidase